MRLHRLGALCVAAALTGCAPAVAQSRPLNASDGGSSTHGGRETAEKWGSLSKLVIRGVIRNHIAEIRQCYERGLAAGPEMEGTVRVRFMISERGDVKRAVVEESTLHAPTVKQCIASAVRKWRFPAPEGGGIVVVHFPFNLELER